MASIPANVMEQVGVFYRSLFDIRVKRVLEFLDAHLTIEKCFKLNIYFVRMLIIFIKKLNLP